MSRLVLRVLDGVQKGAQAPVRDRRLLVGNLLTQCDVVLDVGRPQQHMCLVRADDDGWSVLAIAGDLWVRGEMVLLQETRVIASGDVMRLGEVSFCVADEATIEWASLIVPERVEQPATAPHLHSATASSSADPWRSNRRSSLAGILSLAVLMLSGLGVSLLAMSSAESRVTVAANPAHAAKSGGEVIAEFPWAVELTAQPDSHREGHVQLMGYLPSRSQAAELDSAFRRNGLQAEHRWAAVDDLSADLARRLMLPDSVGNKEEVRYAGQGRFVVTSPDDRFDALHRLVQRALQDMPAIQGIELHLQDGEAGSRKPQAVINYTHAESAPGGVAVAGLEQLRPARALQRFEVMELRRGRLPSVVLDNGARYFEGSSLPGGPVLLQIRSDHLMVQTGEEIRRIELGVTPNE